MTFDRNSTDLVIYLIERTHQTGWVGTVLDEVLTRLAFRGVSGRGPGSRITRVLLYL